MKKSIFSVLAVVLLAACQTTGEDLVAKSSDFSATTTVLELPHVSDGLLCVYALSPDRLNWSSNSASSVFVDEAVRRDLTPGDCTMGSTSASEDPSFKWLGDSGVSSARIKQEPALRSVCNLALKAEDLTTRTSINLAYHRYIERAARMGLTRQACLSVAQM